MRRVNTYVVLTAWLSLVSGVALAQTTASSIAGTVRDTTGGVLPGVTVEASSPALIEKVRSVVTDASGQYRIVDLRPGTYTVTFMLQGFGTVRREGIVLTTGFTAPVSVDLSPGAVSESITVTGEAPLVDIQNTQRQVVMTREVIDTLPTSRNYASVGVLIPGIVLSNTRGPGNSGQDVGGTTGTMATFNTGLMIHGGRRQDQQIQVDGMPIIGWSSIQAPATMMADVNYQEIALNIAANAAEIESGGVRINMIPREGGNSFAGKFFGTFSDPKFQADNVTDTLKQQGLNDPNRLKRLWQYNAFLGGPIVTDKLWFFTAYTRQLNENYVAGQYFNTNVAAWEYVPDLARQAFDIQRGYNFALRGTWQATPRNKVTGFYEFARICQCTLSLGSRNVTLEASDLYKRDTPLVQATWSSPVSNQLLFEAGYSRYWLPTDTQHQPNAVAPRITDTGLGVIYRNGDIRKDKIGNQVTTTLRGSISYVTGTHATKVGVRVLTGLDESTVRFDPEINGMDFRTVNGVPNRVTYYAFPMTSLNYVRPILGVYGQDQWTLRRLTMNLGVRYDYFRARYPDQSISPRQWVPVADFVPARVAVAWHDLSPRLGLSYDLFGDGNTALKLSANRYVLAEGTSRAADINPLEANDRNSRSWRDINGDRVVQGDPLNHAANGELGPSTNLKFGQPESSVTYDRNWAFGFGKRPYNLEFSVGIQHQLLPAVSVSAGYFRRIYGNFEVIANQALTPADFDPYCVITPIDSRLPGGGGQQICGLYDLKANKVGQLDQVVTKASNYGEQREHWNGFDFTMDARLPRLLLQGGLSAGKTMANTCSIATTHPEVTAQAPRGSLWLTTGPSTPADFCHVETPWVAETQVKLLATYMLPWDVQVAGTFQNLPGPPDLASATYRSEQIAPSLGRRLGDGSVVEMDIVSPTAVYGPRLNQLDLRLAKSFRIGASRLQGMFDVYNVSNSNVVTTRSSTYGATTGSAVGSAWLRPQGVLSARLIKFSVSVEF